MSFYTSPGISLRVLSYFCSKKRAYLILSLRDGLCILTACSLISLSFQVIHVFVVSQSFWHSQIDQSTCKKIHVNPLQPLEINFLYSSLLPTAEAEGDSSSSPSQF